MVEVVENYSLDVLHVHYAMPFATSAYLAKQIMLPRSLGVVTTLHGTDITLVGSDPSYLPLTRFSILASDAVTVPSRWLAEATRRMLDLPATFPIDVVPNFVDVDRFRPRARTGATPADRPPVLVHVSNFRPLKRVGDVVAVFARVRAAGPARLRLVGDGPDRAAAVAELARLGLAADAEVFLLPSESESFGLAALEALACGVPVVASDVGGLPEVIADGEVGFLHRVGDVAGMAASARRLLGDPLLRGRMAAAARARAEALFRPEPAIDGYLRVYRWAVGA
jgi:N-acetyl-alpha-D-glucosaminyl L-malate synthase BshA